MTRRGAHILRLSTLTAAAAQAVLPTVLTPSFPRDEQPPDVMQPADVTFVVWLPIFATSAAHGALEVLPSRWARDDGPPGGWPLVGAFLSTAGWAPLVATRRFWAAQGALALIAGLGEAARRRVAAADAAGGLTSADRASVVPATSMLAAWGAAATAVNLTAMLVDRGVVPEGTGSRALGTTAGVAAGAVALGAALTTPGGGRSASALFYSGTWAWALAGIAVAQRRRASPVAAAAAASALAVTVTAVASVARARSAGSG